jgi:hypothetical protein
MVLCGTSLTSTGVVAQELRLEITGRRSPLNDNVFPVIFGKLESSSIIIGEMTFPIQETPISNPASFNQKPIDSRPFANSKDQSAEQIGPASFSVKNLDDPGCIESKNVREIFFLIGLLRDEISKISISSPRNTSCLIALRTKIASLKPVEDDADSLKDKIRVRLHFAQQSTTRKSAGNEKSGVDTNSGAAVPDVKGNPTSGESREITLTINGEDVLPGKDGWFVYEPASIENQIISVKQGSRTLLVKSLAPMVLKAGTTERKTSHYRYIYLITNAELPRAEIAPERLDLKNIVAMSLPFFLKISYGNTRLYPLPGEGKVDRPTLLAGVKSHPLLYGMHIEADGFLSQKSDSQIPVTTLITAVAGSDFLELGNNLSITWGAGVRAFKSRIDNSKAASESGDDALKGRIVIPESVLGPAASFGMGYRNSYIYTEGKITVTPLIIPGSNLITTYNPSIYLGYQLTGADTLTLGYQTHDVRFPTKQRVVKVTASILALGYVRDLQ